MLYLLDANVLITANNFYYPVEAVPEFWEWLAHKAASGEVKMPHETFEEVKDGSNDAARDPLFAWLQDANNRAAILLDAEVNMELVRRVTEVGYAPDLSDDELEQIGRDPFLIAYALEAPAERCVVTTEVSRPRVTRQNRRIPDVCASVGVPCCDTFTMTRALGFSTRWGR